MLKFHMVHTCLLKNFCDAMELIDPILKFHMVHTCSLENFCDAMEVEDLDAI